MKHAREDLCPRPIFLRPRVRGGNLPLRALTSASLGYRRGRYESLCAHPRPRSQLPWVGVHFTLGPEDDWPVFGARPRLVIARLAGAAESGAPYLNA